MPFTTMDDVQAYLSGIPATASDARKWQAVRVATRRLLTAHGVPNAKVWTIEALPPQAYSRYGDCNGDYRRIRYRNAHVTDWWHVTLAATVVHEAAHAVVYVEHQRQGIRGTGGHGKMWRGQAAAMGLREARANNLPSPSSTIAQMAETR